MIDPLPIPEELWAKVPLDVRAAIAAVFLAMQQRVNELETRVRDLEARLQLNVRSDRDEAQTPGFSRREEARRSAWTPQGPAPLGAA